MLMQRLTDDDYKKPYLTVSDILSPEEIKQILRNYEQVTDLCSLVQGDIVKYFEMLANGKYKYKPGGRVLINKQPDYLVLSNGRKSWSVQLNKHVIFREIDIDKIILKYDEIVKKKDKRIEELLYLLEHYKNENKKTSR